MSEPPLMNLITSNGQRKSHGRRVLPLSRPQERRVCAHQTVERSIGTSPATVQQKTRGERGVSGGTVDCGVDLRTRSGASPMPVHFQTRLRLADCPMEIAVFRELLTQTLQTLHPGWNDEDLMHHPTDALNYCSMIRGAEGCGALEDELILRCLLGMRKNLTE